MLKERDLSTSYEEVETTNVSYATFCPNVSSSFLPKHSKVNSPTVWLILKPNSSKASDLPAMLVVYKDLFPNPSPLLQQPPAAIFTSYPISGVED